MKQFNRLSNAAYTHLAQVRMANLKRCHDRITAEVHAAFRYHVLEDTNRYFVPLDSWTVPRTVSWWLNSNTIWRRI